ncbi:dephospho-CoA kinase [Jatrophihabitans sp. DSM 45814]
MGIIGLTGGIGSGKSTVSGRLAELGATIIDADQLARDVVEVGTPGLAKVVERFGPDILTADGSLNRPKLGKLVFGDEKALADLNAIVHPLVKIRMDEKIAAVPPGNQIVYDVALMAENNMWGDYEAVIVVETPLELRLDRLVERGLSREDAMSRIANQATDDERRALATVVVDNSGSLAQLRDNVDKAWAELLASLAASRSESA